MASCQHQCILGEGLRVGGDIVVAAICFYWGVLVAGECAGIGGAAYHHTLTVFVVPIADFGIILGGRGRGRGV
jgi:hypothetical protein